MGHQLMAFVIIGPFAFLYLQRAFYWLMSKTRHITEPCHRSGAAGSISASSLTFLFIATVLVSVQLLVVAPLMS